MSDDTGSPELAVAALFVEQGGERRVLGPCTLLRHDDRVVGIAGSDVLNGIDRAGLRVMTSFDGAETLAVDPPRMTRYLGSLQMTVRSAEWRAHDVVPAPSRCLALPYAVGGGDARLVAVAPRGAGFRRVPIAVTVDAFTSASRGGSGDDVELAFAYVEAPPAPEVLHDGAALIVSYAASRLYGRPAEVLIHGIASTRGGAYPPGRPPAFAWLHTIDLDTSRRPSLS